jgi:predicted nuclease of predicted toxin-antitoxin system
MKFKLDENIGLRGLELLKSAGHDATTVSDEGLSGASDSVLFQVSIEEQRVLVTLDHDFGQVLRFPPQESAGIVILEPGLRATNRLILDRLREFVAALEHNTPERHLWIVEPGRVRIHQPEACTDD